MTTLSDETKQRLIQSLTDTCKAIGIEKLRALDMTKYVHGLIVQGRHMKNKLVINLQDNKEEAIEFITQTVKLL